MHENITALVLDDDNAWRDKFTEYLEGFGIRTIDSVGYMSQAMHKLTSKVYHLLVLDTKEGGQISGPNVAKKAFELGQTPIIIAASVGERNVSLWQNQGFDFHYMDKTIFSREDFYTILKQKFG